MASLAFESQRPVYWRPVTSCFLLLAALCCCCAAPHQKTVNTADPLQTTLGSSTLPDTTKQPETAAVDLGSLLDAGEGAVVTLVAGNTRLAAHRAVLAAGSPILATMFHPDTLPASSNEVNFPGVEGPVLRQLVAFLYTGRANQLPSMAPQLLAAADKYGVSALEDASEQQVLQHLDVDSAAAIAVVAVRLSRHSLMKAVIAFMKAHIFEVLDTHGWSEAVLNHPREVMQMTHLLAQPSADTRTTANGTVSEMPTPTAAPTDATNATTTTPAAADSSPIAAPAAPTAASQTHSGHSWTAATVRLPTAGLHTLPPAAAVVSHSHATTTGSTPTAPVTSAATRATTTAVPAAADSASPATAAATVTLNDTDSASTATAAATATPTATARTAATAQLSTAGSQTPPPDATTVSPLRSLSAKEKGMRLKEAAKQGTVEELRALLAVGADVRATDVGGDTALHWAAVRGHVEVARTLLQAGALVDARDSEWQQTPLHYAAAGGHTAVLRLLLEASADIEARNKHGLTPLHIAAEWDQADAGGALLQAGADKRARDNYGRTALDWAKLKNHQEVVQLLQ